MEPCVGLEPLHVVLAALDPDVQVLPVVADPGFGLDVGRIAAHGNEAFHVVAAGVREPVIGVVKKRSRELRGATLSKLGVPEAILPHHTVDGLAHQPHSRAVRVFGGERRSLLDEGPETLQDRRRADDLPVN